MIYFFSTFIAGIVFVYSHKDVEKHIEETINCIMNNIVDENSFGSIRMSEEMSKLLGDIEDLNINERIVNTKDSIINIATEDYSRMQEEYLKRFHSDFREIKESELYNDPDFQANPLGSIPRGHTFDSYKQVFKTKKRKLANPKTL